MGGSAGSAGSELSAFLVLWSLRTAQNRPGRAQGRSESRPESLRAAQNPSEPLRVTQIPMSCRTGTLLPHRRSQTPKIPMFLPHRHLSLPHRRLSLSHRCLELPHRHVSLPHRNLLLPYRRLVSAARTIVSVAQTSVSAAQTPVSAAQTPLSGAQTLGSAAQPGTCLCSKMLFEETVR